MEKNKRKIPEMNKFRFLSRFIRIVIPLYVEKAKQKRIEQNNTTTTKKKRN